MTFLELYQLCDDICKKRIPTRYEPLKCLTQQLSDKGIYNVVTQRGIPKPTPTGRLAPEVIIPVTHTAMGDTIIVRVYEKDGNPLHIEEFYTPINHQDE